MKRYEQMSKEEIVKFLRSTIDCETCEIKKKCCTAYSKEVSCSATAVKYLEDEFVIRVAKINTIEELNQAVEEWKHRDDIGTFISYLAEEVEK